MDLLSKRKRTATLCGWFADVVIGSTAMGPRRDWQTPANANWREKDKVQAFIAPVREGSTQSHTTGALFTRSDAITWQNLVQYGMCWCKGNLNTDTNRRKTREEAISSQGMLSPPSVRWGAWIFLSWHLQRKHGPGTCIFSIYPSGLWDNTFLSLSHPGSGSLLQQPWNLEY